MSKKPIHLHMSNPCKPDQHSTSFSFPSQGFNSSGSVLLEVNSGLGGSLKKNWDWSTASWNAFNPQTRQRIASVGYWRASVRGKTEVECRMSCRLPVRLKRRNENQRDANISSQRILELLKKVFLLHAGFPGGRRSDIKNPIDLRPL